MASTCTHITDQALQTHQIIFVEEATTLLDLNYVHSTGFTIAALLAPIDITLDRFKELLEHIRNADGEIVRMFRPTTGVQSYHEGILRKNTSGCRAIVTFGGVTALDYRWFQSTGLVTIAARPNPITLSYVDFQILRGYSDNLIAEITNY